LIRRKGGAEALIGFIKTYKIITGKEAIQWDRLFELAPSRVTRGHRYTFLRKGKEYQGGNF